MHQTKQNIALMLMGIAVASLAGALAVSQSFDATADALAGPIDQGLMRGHVEVELVDKETGMIKAYRQSDNAVLDTGKDALADELWPGSAGELSTEVEDLDYHFIEIDTDNTTPSEAQTGVIGSATCARVADTDAASLNSGSAGTVVATIVSTFDGNASGCASTFAEAGLYNSLTATNGFARNTYSGVTLTTSDDLVITWNVTFD